MSGTDPLEQPEERIQTSGEAVSSSPPPAAPPGMAVPGGHSPLDASGAPIVRPFPLHPSFGWAILWCIALLLFTQVPGGLLAVVIIFAAMFLFPQSIRPEDLKDTASLLNNPLGLFAFGSALVAAHALIILFALVLLRILAGRDWPRQVALRLPSWTQVGLIVAVWPAFSFLANGVGHIIQRYLHVPSFFFHEGEGGANLDKILSGWVLIPAVFVISVMPAISEELWCRAFLGRGLVGKHGPVLGVLGTSFLFGVIHVDPAQGMVAMVMGVGLHYFYLTSRSLLIPSLMHFLNNALAVVLPSIPHLSNLGRDENQGEKSLALYTGGAIFLFAVCWALYQSRPRLRSDGPGPAWQPPYPGVVLPPPGSGTHLETPPLSQMSLTLLVAGLAAFVAGLVMTLQRIN
jgi:membrane protease YdiL (CAAX protease family)